MDKYYRPINQHNMNRPIGVAIIAVLNMLAGIYQFLSGAGLIGTAGRSIVKETIPNTAEGVGTAMGTGAAGIISIIIGLLTFIVALALWRMKAWAWLVAMVLAVLNVAHGAYALYAHGSSPGTVGPLIVYIILLVYLYSVRNHFRKGA